MEVAIIVLAISLAVSALSVCILTADSIRLNRELNRWEVDYEDLEVDLADETQKSTDLKSIGDQAFEALVELSDDYVKLFRELATELDEKEKRAGELEELHKAVFEFTQGGSPYGSNHRRGNLKCN